ncbi:hypothetical protein TNCV_4925561 [Trichonephila clavipes]|nr:hypothetical protein TNCV_4925561 [Trichonephila clavipes]
MFRLIICAGCMSPHSPDSLPHLIHIMGVGTNSIAIKSRQFAYNSIGVTSFAIRGHDFHVENFPAVSSNQCTDSNKRSMPTGLPGPITANYNRIYGVINNFSSAAAFFIDAFASASLISAIFAFILS